MDHTPKPDQPDSYSQQLKVRVPRVLHRHLREIAARNETSVQMVVFHLLHFGLRAAEAHKVTDILGTKEMELQLFGEPPKERPR